MVIDIRTIVALGDRITWKGTRGKNWGDRYVNWGDCYVDLYICQYSSSCKREIYVFSSVQMILQLTASKLKLKQKLENCTQPNTTKLVEVTWWRKRSNSNDLRSKKKKKTKSLMEVRGQYEDWHYNEFEKDTGKEKWKKTLRRQSINESFNKTFKKKCLLYLFSRDDHEC